MIYHSWLEKAQKKVFWKRAVSPCLAEKKANLALGLGGHGIEYLKALKEEILLETAPDKADTTAVLPGVRFLAVDSSQTALEQERIAPLNALSECFVLANSYLSQHPQMLGVRPECSWLNTEQFNTGLLEMGIGAGGERQVGRALFMVRSDVFRYWIQQSILDLRKECGEDAELDIHIFAGMGGGTGSGIFLDVCYVIRHVLKELGQKGDLHLYCLLPENILEHQIPKSSEAIQEKVQANCYAALKELDYCMHFPQNGKEWSQTYKGFSAKDSAIPACSYLISEWLGQSEAAAVARFVFGCSFVKTESSQLRYRGLYDPASSVLLRQTGVYSVLGTTRVADSQTQIRDLAFTKLMKDYLEHLQKNVRNPLSDEMKREQKEIHAYAQKRIPVLNTQSWKSHSFLHVEENERELPLPENVQAEIQHLLAQWREEVKRLGKSALWRFEEIFLESYALRRFKEIFYVTSEKDDSLRIQEQATIERLCKERDEQLALYPRWQEDQQHCEAQIRMLFQRFQGTIFKQHRFKEFCDQMEYWFSIQLKIILVQEQVNLLDAFLKKIRPEKLRLFFDVLETISQTVHQPEWIRKVSIGNEFTPHESIEMEIYIASICNNTAKFCVDLFHCTEAWQENDPEKLAKFVNEWFSGKEQLLQRVSTMFRLESIFESEDWSRTHEISENVARCVNTLSKPLFAATDALEDSRYQDKYTFRICQIPNGCPEIEKWISQWNAQETKATEQFTEMADFPFELQILYGAFGISLTEYLYLATYAESYRKLGGHNHLYTGSAADPRDWRNLPDPV